MLILGLDLAVHTGWAICVDGEIIESGVQSFDLQRGESPGMRFLRFRSWLKTLYGEALTINHDRSAGIHPAGPAVLAYEQSHHRGGPATMVAVGLATRVLELAAEVGCESLPIHSATLKKRITGSGRASKADMIAAAEQRVGRQGFSEDEADAICCAFVAWEQVKA